MEDFWVVDGHCDSLGDFTEGKRDLKQSMEEGHWDLPKARKSKIALQFMAAFIESKYKPYLATQRGLQLIGAAHRFLAQNREEVFLIQQREDLEQVSKNKKIAILLSVEGGEVLNQDLFMLDILYKLGVRALGLTWNQRNALADGIGEDTGSRLTRFGRTVVCRMNELGMVTDVSHINEAGFWHVLEISTLPVIASHSCAKKLCPHPRNLDDSQLKALAEQGGIVGVNFCPDFLVEAGQAKREDVIRHIAHIVEVAGIRTVGLGSDFDGIEEAPVGLEDAGQYQLFAEDLLKAGFTGDEVAHIFYKNFMRLLSQVLK